MIIRPKSTHVDLGLYYFMGNGLHRSVPFLWMGFFVIRYTDT